MTVTNRDLARSGANQSGSASITMDNQYSITSKPQITRANDDHVVVVDKLQQLQLQQQLNVQPKNTESVACTKQAAEVEGKVDSFDHVTFWVGNAKHSAVYYMTQFGFQPFAFCGLETGSRDLACHVVKLNETIIQFVSAVEPNNETLNKFLMSHGDAVKDVAFRVENIEALLKHAIEQGAELVSPLETVVFNPKEKEKGEVESGQNHMGICCLKRATIKTFGDVTHTFIERNYEYELAKFLPGYKKPSLEVGRVI